MVCPHCSTGVHLETEETENWEADDFQQTGRCYTIAYAHCPECEGLIVRLQYGKGLYGVPGSSSSEPYLHMTGVTSEHLIFPATAARPVEPEVPSRIRKDYQEACAVLSISPKASAALSRRLLQDVFREHLGIKNGSLAEEIDTFLCRSDVPSYLTEAIDAVRHIGNFAAHPLKDTHSGEVVDVEPGEAEWLLEVVESLFDFTFVQPKRLAARRDALNKKLTALGKPKMKGKAAASPEKGDE